MTTTDHGHAQVSAFTPACGDRDGTGLFEPMPSLALDGFDEPANAFPEPWLHGPGASLADHPLLRGLLLELPPKASPPSPEWMNRWFEAARVILDLIYNGR